jgi:L-asparagine oxygenase
MTLKLSHTSVLTSEGFAFIPGFERNRPSLDIAAELGFIDSVEGLNPVQILTPRAKHESTPNTYSGNFGYSEFPFHTDLAQWALPPRYLLLRCIHGTATVFTRLLDGQALIKQVGANRLHTALAQPRRPMRNGKQLLRLLAWSDVSSCNLLRWDSIYLHPASAASADVFAEVFQFLREAPYTNVNLLEPGDTLLVDNWRYLHARSAATEEDRERHLERVYLKEVR